MWNVYETSSWYHLCYSSLSLTSVDFFSLSKSWRKKKAHAACHVTKEPKSRKPSQTYFTCLLEINQEREVSSLTSCWRGVCISTSLGIICSYIVLFEISDLTRDMAWPQKHWTWNICTNYYSVRVMHLTKVKPIVTFICIIIVRSNWRWSSRVSHHVWLQIVFKLRSNSFRKWNIHARVRVHGPPN